VLIDLDFFSSPGNAGLTNAGGTITVLTAGTNLYQIAANTYYGVRTGAVMATPEPTSSLLGGTGVLLLGFVIRRRVQSGSRARPGNQIRYKSFLPGAAP
jgi:hypothetical protein